MKSIVILALMLGQSSIATADDKICFEQQCVGDRIVDIYGSSLKQAAGILQKIEFEKISADYSIPNGVIRLDGGKLVPVDLRTTTLLEKDKCMDVNGTRFCQGDEVVVIPGFDSGSRKQEPARIVTVFRRNSFGDERIYILSSSPGQQDKFSLHSHFGFADQKQCFGESESICVGDSYDNGLGSTDVVLGYYPNDKGALVRLGDLQMADKNDMLSYREIESRKKGIYRTVRHISQYLFANSKAFRDKEKQMQELALRKAQEECRYSFSGKGILDSKQSEQPKISKCKKERELLSISHGTILGPSSTLGCFVDFHFVCRHPEAK